MLCCTKTCQTIYSKVPLGVRQALAYWSVANRRFAQYIAKNLAVQQYCQSSFFKTICRKNKQLTSLFQNASLSKNFALQINILKIPRHHWLFSLLLYSTNEQNAVKKQTLRMLLCSTNNSFKANNGYINLWTGKKPSQSKHLVTSINIIIHNIKIHSTSNFSVRLKTSWIILKHRIWCYKL